MTWILAASAGGGGGADGSGLRILFALVVVVIIALIAANRRLWLWRRSAIGATLITGGWVAVGIGLAVGPHAVALVDAEHVQVLRPLVLFCLGWVGLMIGLQLRADLPRLLPAGVLRLTLVDLVASLLVIGLAAGAALWLATAEARDTWSPLVMVALVLGTCGVGWAAEVRSLSGTASTANVAANILRAAAGLAAIFAILIYGLLFIIMRHGPTGAAAALPMAVGLAVSLLVALVGGVIGLWLMRIAGRSESQFLVVLLGIVSFIAGAADVLGYSPLFVAMLSGVMIVNLPGRALTHFRRVVIDAEQPVAMALMLVAGVVADPFIGTLGVALVVLMFAGRLIVKLPLGGWWATGNLEHKPGALALAPVRQAPLAIALAIGYALSGHDQNLRLITGSQLVMVVIILGLLSDITPQVIRMFRGDAGPSHRRTDAQRDEARHHVTVTEGGGG
mgnify:FL=1